MSLELPNQIDSARGLLKAAAHMWGEAHTPNITKDISRQRERRAMALYAQAQVHATIAVYEKLEALTEGNARTATHDGTTEPVGIDAGDVPKWLDDMTTTDEVLTEPTVKRPWKRDALLRWLQQFDGGSNFYLQNGKVIVTTPTGRAVKPRFWYPSNPLLSIKVGTRVRKFGYSDTGTVAAICTDPGAHEFRVSWDNTGGSWENAADLGVAVEH